MDGWMEVTDMPSIEANRFSYIFFRDLLRFMYILSSQANIDKIAHISADLYEWERYRFLILSRECKSQKADSIEASSESEAELRWRFEVGQGLLVFYEVMMPVSKLGWRWFSLETANSLPFTYLNNYLPVLASKSEHIYGPHNRNRH